MNFKSIISNIVLSISLFLFLYVRYTLHHSFTSMLRCPIQDHVLLGLDTRPAFITFQELARFQLVAENGGTIRRLAVTTRSLY